MTPLSILVAGGCGYIGTHMVKALLQAGHRVVTVDNLSTGHRELLPGGRLVEGDIGHPELLDRVLAAERFDAAMHFAACIEVGESVANPLKYYRNNVAGTLSLLEALVRHGVDKLIFSSSAAVYGEPEAVPIAEDHPCRPTNPYGHTKQVVETMLADCARACGLRYAALRYFNAAGADASGAIGERHHPESHLIPLVLEVAAGRRERIAIFGTDHATPDGTCVRDFVHVNDLAAAHLLALEALAGGAPSGAFNLGSSRGYSVREVIATARRVTGHPIPAVEAPRRAGDPAMLVASSDKARRELGWRPAWESLEEIVASAWKWHRSL